MVNVAKINTVRIVRDKENVEVVLTHLPKGTPSVKRKPVAVVYAVVLN